LYLDTPHAAYSIGVMPRGQDISEITTLDIFDSFPPETFLLHRSLSAI
jgi:hypothetical protein